MHKTLAACLVTALLAGSGTAVANHLIESKDIKNGTIQHRDLSPTVRADLTKPGIPGAKGAKGDQGPQGATGSAGRDGRDGLNGSSGGTGATGPAGPKGEKGDQGATGPIGPVGPAGSAGDVEFVAPTVSTGYTNGELPENGTVYSPSCDAENGRVVGGGAQFGNGLSGGRVVASYPDAGNNRWAVEVELTNADPTNVIVYAVCGKVVPAS